MKRTDFIALLLASLFMAALVIKPDVPRHAARWNQDEQGLYNVVLDSTYGYDQLTRRQVDSLHIILDPQVEEHPGE